MENHLKTDMRGGMEELTYWIDREIIFLFVFRYSVSNQTVLDPSMVLIGLAKGLCETLNPVIYSGNEPAISTGLKSNGVLF